MPPSNGSRACFTDPYHDSGNPSIAKSGRSPSHETPRSAVEGGIWDLRAGNALGPLLICWWESQSAGSWPKPRQDSDCCHQVQRRFQVCSPSWCAKPQHRRPELATSIEVVPASPGARPSTSPPSVEEVNKDADHCQPCHPMPDEARAGEGENTTQEYHPLGNAKPDRLRPF